MSDGSCWNCLASQKGVTPFCGKCGAPLADTRSALAGVDYLIRELGRWTWLPAERRAEVMRVYHERRQRLTYRATAPAVSAPPPAEPLPKTAVPETAPTAPPPWHPVPVARADDEWGHESTDSLARDLAVRSESHEALDAAQAFLHKQNIRWFHALGALLLVVAGVGYLRANWDTIGTIAVTFGLLVLPVVSFWGSVRLRATLPDSSRGLAVLGSVTLPAGLLALEIFGFVHVPRPAWQFVVFALTAGVLGWVAHLLAEVACVYLSAVSTLLAAAQLTTLAPGAFGYPVLAFAFVSAAWAARARDAAVLSIHLSSVGQMMARIALVATFGNGVDPDVNHLVVGVIVSAWFVYGAVLSPEPSGLTQAAVSCALTWLLVYLRVVAGAPTPEGVLERVLAPMGAVLAVTAQQLSVRFDRRRALPVARFALLIGAVVLVGVVVLGVAALPAEHDTSGVRSPQVLMVAIEIAALSFLFSGWPLGGRDASQTLLTVASVALPFGVACIVPTVAAVRVMGGSLLAETLVALAFAQGFDRTRGRGAAQFFGQLALLLGSAALVLVVVMLVSGHFVNATGCLIVVAVAAAALEPLFRRWPMYSDVFPMDLVLDGDASSRALSFELGPRPALQFSMSALLSNVAALVAPLAAAALTYTGGVLDGVVEPSAPLAAAVTVALALLVLAWRAHDDEQRDVHWREATRLGSFVGAMWPATVALVYHAWVPGLQSASYTLGVAAVIFACHAALFTSPGLEHLAYFLVHALLIFNVATPIALEWYTLPLGLWVLVWTRRHVSDKEMGELAGLLTLGGPSLLAAFEQGYGPHLAWALGVNGVALGLGLCGRRRAILACSAMLLVGAAFEVSQQMNDYSIVFGAASALAVIIEPAFRTARREGVATASADGVAAAATSGQVALLLTYTAVLLAPVAAACRLFVFASRAAGYDDPFPWGMAALGGVLGAVFLHALRGVRGLGGFARDSEECDVHWGRALDVGSMVAAVWSGALAVVTGRPGIDPGAVAALAASALLVVQATRPGRVALSHLAFAYIFGLFQINLPPVLATGSIRLELVCFPLAGWLFFSAYWLHAATVRAPLEALASLVLGGASLLASFGPHWETHAVATGVAGLALFTVGSLTDRAVPTALGAFFLGAEALYRLHHVLVSMPWQLYATVAGLFLIATGVLIERRRVWLLAYGDKIAQQWTYRGGVLSAPPRTQDEDSD